MKHIILPPGLKRVDVLKTRKEKELFKKYKSLLDNATDYIEHYVLALQFKEDLVKLLRVNKKYRHIALICVFFLLKSTLSFSQSNIVTAGGDIENYSYTVGNNLVELQIPVIEEAVLSIPKFETPVEQPKKPVSKKKSLFEKIIDFIKKLIST